MKTAMNPKAQAIGRYYGGLLRVLLGVTTGVLHEETVTLTQGVVCGPF